MDYDDMLDQAIEDSPDVERSGERFQIPDPELRQEGNETVFENFQSVCDRLSRDENHVMKSLQNEVGTSAHIDESGRARLTGSFGERRIAEALEAYARAFVLCPECGLPDTVLKTEQDATVLRCEACGAQSPAGE